MLRRAWDAERWTGGGGPHWAEMLEHTPARGGAVSWWVRVFHIRWGCSMHVDVGICLAIPPVQRRLLSIEVQ